MKRLAAWPLFMCGFRPFFLAGSLLACVLMAAWLLMLGGGVAHLVHVVTARRRCNLACL